MSKTTDEHVTADTDTIDTIALLTVNTGPTSNDCFSPLPRFFMLIHFQTSSSQGNGLNLTSPRPLHPRKINPLVKEQGAIL